MQAKVRDFLVELARTHRRFRFRDSDRINESVLAREIGVAASTIHRILHLERNVLPGREADDYTMSPRLKRGLMRLRGFRDEAELLEAILNAPEGRAD